MKTFAALFGLAATLAVAAPAAGTPAAAACSYGPATTGGTTHIVEGGKIVPAGDGFRLVTDEVADAALWKLTLGQPVKLSAVTQLSYRATKLDDGKTNAAAMPAFRIYLDNGKTLYFEPYYQAGDHLDGTGNPKLDTWTTFDVDAGKFWQTGEAGGSYAGNRTLAQFKTLYPAAKVVAVGVGQGTHNAGTIGRFDRIVFKADEPCTAPSPSASSSSSSATARPSAGGSAGTVPAGLPVTGAPTGLLVALGIGALLAGAGLVAIVARRRGARFAA